MAILDRRVKKIMNSLHASLEHVRTLKFRRMRKLTPEHLFMFLVNKIKSGTSCTMANLKLKTDGLVDVVPSAITKMRQKIHSDVFCTLHDDLLKLIHSDLPKKKYRIFGVDGSSLSVSKSFNKEINPNSTTNYRTVPKKTYCKVAVTCLYDVVNEIPYGCFLDDTYNERKAFQVHLLDRIPENAIITFDRGYYSRELAKTLRERNIKFIFRLKKDHGFVKLVNDSTDIVTEKDGYQYRVTKYHIGPKAYYLCTNVFDENEKFLQETYKLRWGSEEYYKILKRGLNMETINTRTEDFIKQELYVSEWCTTFGRYLELLGLHEDLVDLVKKDTGKFDDEVADDVSINVNFKAVMQVVNDCIVPIIIKTNISDLCKVRKIRKLVKFMVAVKVYFVRSRHYERVAKRQGSGWDRPRGKRGKHKVGNIEIDDLGLNGHEFKS